MAARKHISEATQTNVLVRSKRRCCICFGLTKDISVKKGQIAHVDRNADNNAFSNLAFLCLEHHDEYDSRTSQSKGLTAGELKRYRDDLYSHFAPWSTGASRDQFLNFLAATVDVDVLTDAAIKTCNGLIAYGIEHAYYVLIASVVEYSDSDLLIPHQLALDAFESWGWLDYEEEEVELEDGDSFTRFCVTHRAFCRDIAVEIRNRVKAGAGNLSMLDHYDALARHDAS